MAFVWKEHKDIFKGEGIYHLTFVVVGRRPLLGRLVPLADSRAYSGSGASNRSYLGDVERPDNINGLLDNANGLLDNKGGMPDNADGLPYEGWRKELCVTKLATVRLSSFALAVSRDLKALPERFSYAAADGEPAIIICGKQFMPNHLHVVIWVKKDVGKSIRQIAQGFRIGVRKIAEDMGIWRREDGHVFEVPFIRTLSRRGQLASMIRYVHANPDSAWMRRLHPDMYVIRRNQVHAGLHFDSMGKARLLDYPDRQVIALSRSLTPEQIETEVQKALRKAERGVVTYCAAMNDAEKAVTRAIRNGGYPLVVMMLDGFPPESSEAARFYKPGGAYHRACGDGLLYLMAPSVANYQNARLIELTDAELKRKDEAKGYTYRPLPHDSKRWRMIAGNMMLGLIADEER